LTIALPISVFYYASVSGQSIAICGVMATVVNCLSTSMVSLELLIQSSPNFLCMAVTWSSSGGIAICYVLPASWMTSHLAIMGHMVYFVTGAEFDVYGYLVL